MPIFNLCGIILPSYCINRLNYTDKDITEEIMKRKFAAIALAIAMVFTLMPVTHVSVAYADDAAYQLTDTELIWTAPENAVCYQIQVFGQWMQDDEGGPDYYETSFPRNKIDRYITRYVIDRGLEPEETYTIYICPVAADGGALEAIEVAYPNPMDGKIKNVRVNDYGSLVWDDYYPYIYKVYANDLYLGQGIEETDDYYFYLNDELDRRIQDGTLKKAEDNTYTIRIDDVEGDDNVIASWEGTHTYETDTENPNFENIRIEDGELRWDYAPYSEYIDVYIDGALVHEVSNYSELSPMIDKLVVRGKIDKAITDHEIDVKAYQYNESGEGGDYFLYEWTGSYEYVSDKEMLTGFPEDMAIDKWGNIEWSYFKDVEYFRYYINEYVNSSYWGEELDLRYRIDDLISEGRLTKAEDGVYSFKLEAMSEEGAVLGTFEGSYTYESPFVAPADTLYYLAVYDETKIVWNRVNRAEEYKVYIEDEYVDSMWSTRFESVDSYIDRLIYNDKISKPEDDTYTIRVDALRTYWDEDDEEVTEVISSKELDFHYVSSVIPVKDDFESVVLYLDDPDDYYYRLLVWNEIRNADHYVVKVGEHSNYSWYNYFNICDFIDRCIEAGMEKADEYTVTIEAYNYDDEVIASYTNSFAYESKAEALPTEFEELELDGEECRVSWNQIGGANKYRYTIDGKSGTTWNTYIWVSSILYDWITYEGFPNNEDHTIFIEALDYDGNVIATSATLSFKYKSNAKPQAAEFTDVEFVYSENYDEWSVYWNPVIDAYQFRLTITGVYSTVLEGDCSGVVISDHIDSAIRNGKIEKLDSYEIILEALDYNGNSVCDPWTGTFVYDSKAELLPEDFVIIEESHYSDYYYINWKDVRNAYYYDVYVNGNLVESRDWTGLELYDFIDKWIYGGRIEKQDSYEIVIKATTYKGEELASITRSVTYDSPAVPPADHLLPESVRIDESDGTMYWNVVTTPHNEYEVYYKLTIDGYVTGTYNNYFYLYSEIDELVEHGDIPDVADHTYKLEAYKVLDDEDGNRYELIGEPCEGTFTYRAPQEVVITIENGVLNATYTDGEEISDFNYGWIMANNDHNAEQYVGTLPFNINDAIDAMIQGNESFAKTGVYDLYFYGYTNRNFTIYGYYNGYQYDSQAEYIKPVDMKLTKNGKIVSWDLVEGTDEYCLEIEGAHTSYGYYEDISEYDVEQFVDELISEGKLIPSEDGQYTFTVTAYNEKRVLIGEGSITFEYHSQVVPAEEMEVRVSEDGTLTWDPVEGAVYYQVGVYEWYTNGTTDNKANINDIISKGIQEGYISAESSYDICVLAYDSNNILLAKWIQFGYNYDSSTIPDHQHSFGPWTPYDDTCHCRTCAEDGFAEFEDHRWNIDTVPATCEEDGSKIYTCAVCGFTKTEVLPATGHNYEEVIIKATQTKDGAKKVECSNCHKFKSAELIPAAKTIKLSKAAYVYDGKVKKPNVVVKDLEGNALDKSLYTVKTPTGRKKVGKYTYTVTMDPELYDVAAKKLTLTVKPAKAVISKLTPGSKSIKVTIKSQKTSGVTGYQIAYKVKSASKWTTVKTKNLTYTIKKLKKGKTYSVKVRAYKTAGKTTIYGAYSKVLNKKVTKG